MTAIQDQPLGEALLAQSAWLRRLVRSLVRDRSQVDDLCQATLLEAWRHRPDHQRSLRPWLARVARHLCARWAVRERQRPAREAAVARTGSAPAAGAVVEKFAWHQTVAHAVMALPEPYRTTVLLRFWDNVPPRAIANRTGVPVETVRTRLKRGLAMVRQRLDGECGNRRVWVTALLPLARLPGGAIALTTALLMTKKTILLLGALASGVALAFLCWPNGPTSSPGAPSTDGTTVAAASSGRTDTAEAAHQRLLAVEPRSAGGPDAARESPELAAWLTGFRGRVVDAAGVPIRDCEVRVHRVAADTLLGLEPESFGVPAPGPELTHHGTRTDDAGEFLVAGVRPRGAYLLLARADSDDRTMRVLERTPAPGEVVDLGDVMLMQCASLTGTVVDDDGEPVAGALVRAIDLPAELFAAMPLERFDPNGALLVRPPGVANPVITMPAVVCELYEQLPIAATVTGTDGRFRLPGITPGDNVVAITKDGHQSAVKSRVKFPPGGQRELGVVQLRDGEGLIGRVIDTGGQPVVGAEVLVAPTSPGEALDLASFVEPTDADGRFSADGLPAGRATVAVRRGPCHAWVLVAPQPVARDLVVTLPATHALTVRVHGTAGERIANAGLEVVPGRIDEPTVMMRRMGLLQPLDLRGRTEHAEGSLRVPGLEAGHYVVAIAAPGHATTTVEVELRKDRELEIELQPARAYAVRVTTVQGAPVPRARVYARPVAALAPPTLLPLPCGETDADGRLRIASVHAERVHVTASHPRYGFADAEIAFGSGELVLVMPPPGAIRGRLTEDGEPPELGKWAVLLEAGYTEDTSVLRQSPRLAVVGRAGGFEFGGVAPGRYSLTPVSSAAAATSPGQILAVLDEWDYSTLQSTSVQVRSGYIAEPTIALGETSAAADGTIPVSGSLVVDGLPGAGLRIQLRDFNSGGRAAEATVDRAGWFDLGRVPNLRFYLEVRSEAGPRSRDILYRGDLERILEPDGSLRIDIQTAGVAGTVVGPTGAPVADAVLEVMCVSIRSTGLLFFKASSDAQGRFEVTRLPAGRYRIHACRLGAPVLFGDAEELELLAGAPRTGLRLQLRSAATVRGRVDLGALGLEDQQPTLQFRRRDRIRSGNSVSEITRDGIPAPVAADGSFAMQLPAGTYYVELTSGGERKFAQEKTVEIGTEDIDDLVLRLAEVKGRG